MNNRRDFIKTLGTISFAAAAMYTFPGCLKNDPDIGIQLYTLRDPIKDGVVPVLQELSKIGYNNIEAYNFNGKFFEFDPGEFKKIINDLGMKLTSTHTGITLENADEYIEAAKIAGLQFLVIPYPGSWPHDSIDDYKKMAEQFNLIGERVSGAGMNLGYHNHALEFELKDGEVPYDILLKETDPELVCFQPDIYWFKKGGADPIEYINEYPGRFKVWHIKDMAVNGDTTAVGKGNIDFPEIFKFADIAGMKYFYVEQEQYDKAPIDCCQESIDYIKNNLV
ncbi:sugar phosphate isomerase/epimerase family protein [Bacteroidota bacterium]